MTVLIDGLIAARNNRQPFAHPAGIGPASLADGYAAQEVHVARLLEQLGGTQIGYKLGATNHDTMKAMGFDAPFTGPILSAWTHNAPASLQRSDFFVCVIEAEVGFRLGRDLPSTTSTRQEVIESVAEIFPTLEIADSRLQDWKNPGAPTILADLGNAGALVIGSPLQNWHKIDLDTLAVELSADGETVARGTGAMVLDNPLGRLVEFARERAAIGYPLKAGEIVSTGTCTPPYPAKAGQTLTGHFGPLGTISLTLL